MRWACENGSTPSLDASRRRAPHPACALCSAGSAAPRPAAAWAAARAAGTRAAWPHSQAGWRTSSRRAERRPPATGWAACCQARSRTPVWWACAAPRACSNAHGGSDAARGQHGSVAAGTGLPSRSGVSSSVLAPPAREGQRRHRTHRRRAVASMRINDAPRRAVKRAAMASHSLRGGVRPPLRRNLRFPARAGVRRRALHRTACARAALAAESGCLGRRDARRRTHMRISSRRSSALNLRRRGGRRGLSVRMEKIEASYLHVAGRVAAGAPEAVPRHGGLHPGRLAQGGGGGHTICSERQFADSSRTKGAEPVDTRGYAADDVGSCRAMTARAGPQGAIP